MKKLIFIVALIMLVGTAWAWNRIVLTPIHSNEYFVSGWGFGIIEVGIGGHEYLVNSLGGMCHSAKCCQK